uniref:Protein S100 n=1 Tax=Oryzias melastigma TaxID=30732 RepID=A0A3B3D988_ORYME
MSSIIEAIAVLRCIFDKYAGKEGDPKTLTKKEMVTLLKEQLGGAPEKPEVMDKFFKDLDADGDGVVDFNEYVVLVVAIVLLYYSNGFYFGCYLHVL